MWERLLAFLSGRLYIKVQGGNLARFINESLREGIVFFGTRRSAQGMDAQIRLKDFRRLRRAAKTSGSRVRIQSKYGLPFITARWERRKGLVAGTLIIAVTLGVLAQMVLSVEVKGNDKVPTPVILDAAARHGLKTMSFSRNLDLDEIAEAIQEEFPNIAWVGIQKQGTHYVIEVVEKVPPKVPGERGNLVAAKDGLVEDVIVIQGTAMVQEGQFVRTGQVLIKAPEAQVVFEVQPQSSPEVPAAVESQPTVSGQAIPGEVPVAKGFVRGRVWYSAEARVPLKEDLVRETGQTTTAVGIKFGDRVIMVTNPDSPYEHADKEVILRPLLTWRNWRFPVEFITIKYKELEAMRVERTVAEARALGERKARAELRGKIPPGVQVLQERVRVLSGDAGEQAVRVEAETYEDLAVYPNP